MSKVFFTSDTHGYHGNIIKYCGRPFLSSADAQALADHGGKWHDGSWKGTRSSNWQITKEAIEMMNDELIKNINDMVGVHDILWHLGDFVFGSKHNYYQNAKQFRNRIKCRNVNLIWGNHDERSIQDLFSYTYDLTDIKVNGQKIILCHYAMAVWDSSHRGAWQLYGHSHSAAEPWMDKNMVGRRSFDVGIDNAKKVLGAYRPWSFDEIKSIMDKREGFSMDHHIPKNAQGPREEELIKE